MPLPNTLSQVKAPAFIEIPYDHVEIDFGGSQEVVSLDPLIVDAKTGTSAAVRLRLAAQGGNLMEDQTNGPATRAREEGALELAESKSMKPYMSMTIAMIQGRDVATALREIASLPLEGPNTFQGLA